MGRVNIVSEGNQQSDIFGNKVNVIRKIDRDIICKIILLLHLGGLNKEINRRKNQTPKKIVTYEMPLELKKYKYSKKNKNKNHNFLAKK